MFSPTIHIHDSFIRPPFHYVVSLSSSPSLHLLCPLPASDPSRRPSFWPWASQGRFQQHMSWFSFGATHRCFWPSNMSLSWVSPKGEEKPPALAELVLDAFDFFSKLSKPLCHSHRHSEATSKNCTHTT
ncbi:hypothetical protein ACSBR1_033984 [Camellia fascicularis]